MKLVSKGGPQKVAEYSKYMNSSGGYDYSWTLKDAASELTVGGKSIVECGLLIKKSITRPAEVEHNLFGLNSLSAWMSGQQGTFFKPPSAVCWSPKKHLGIKLAPEFGIMTTAGPRVVTLWNTKTPDLSQQIAGIGIYLMQHHLPLSEYQTCDCAILDLRKKKLYASIKTPANVANMVASEFAWVDQFFETIKQAAA